MPPSNAWKGSSIPWTQTWSWQTPPGQKRPSALPFEVVQKVRDVNREQKTCPPEHRLTGNLISPTNCLRSRSFPYPTSLHRPVWRITWNTASGFVKSTSVYRAGEHPCILHWWGLYGYHRIFKDLFVNFILICQTKDFWQIMKYAVTQSSERT